MPQAPREQVDLQFPLGGVVEGMSHGQQPPITTWDCKNVKPFDVSEDRARGGRREGIEKVTTTPVSSTAIQMVRSLGIVPGDSTVFAPGALSQFAEQAAEDNGITHRFGFFNYSGLNDGAQLTEANLGLAFRGLCCAGVTFNDTVSDDFALSAGTLNYNPNAFILPRNESNASTLVLQNSSSHGGITKQTDANGSPYIAIRPSHFPFGDTQDPFSALAPSNAGGGNDMANSGDHEKSIETTYRKKMVLFPQIVTGEHTWNSSPEKEYVCRVEFRFPNTHNSILGGESVVDGVTGQGVEFVETAADLGDGKVYDPWYTHCMTTGSGTFPSTAVDNKFSFSGFGSSGLPNDFRSFGFLFRNGIDFDTSTAATGWQSSTSGSNLPFSVSFTCFNASGTVNNDQWSLRAGPLDGQEIGVGVGLSTGFNYTIDREADPNNETYHTLEVRVKKNKVSIFFDGTNVKTYNDITVDFPTLATTEETDTATTYGHSALYYVSRDSYTGGVSGSSSASNAARQMAYFATRDWSIRENPTGTAGETAASADTTGRIQQSDELRIRNVQWMEGGPLLAVPQNTLVVSGGDLYTSQSQSEYSRASTSPFLDPGQSTVGGIEYLQKFYLVDGSNYKIYDPNAAAVVSDWNASPGDLPGGDGNKGTYGDGTSDGNARCTIIASWLGRVVLSGKNDDPQNWFMSAIGDPLDYDYLGGNADTGAVQGSSTTKFGELASPVSALIPGSGTRLYVGGLNSLHVLTGDPLWDNSAQHALSLDVGVVGPYAWCYGPNKSVYFMSENGLYLLEPNDFDVTQSDRLSAGKFDKTFGDVAFDSVTTFLAYDYKNHGVHIFVTPRQQGSGPAKHFYYDRRANSFWPMELPSVVGPTALYDFRSEGPELRRILMGGFDGHLRAFSDTAKDDDGTAISSHVWLGPIIAGPMREAKLTELVAVLDEQSPDVNYEVYVADTVEGAKSSTAVYSSTWSSGRNDSRRLRARGSAIFIKVFDSSVNLPWVYEKLTAVLALAGRSRQR